MTEKPVCDQSYVQHVVIGNPGSRRVEFFQAALRGAGCQPARVLSYKSLLDDDCESIAQRLAGTLEDLPDAKRYLRIESPGGSFGVEKRLTALGADHPELGNCERISRRGAARTKFDRGRLRFARQRYLGFRRLLDAIETAASSAGNVSWYNHPRDIAVLFDKIACQSKLEQHGVSVPKTIDDVRDFRHLIDSMRENNWRRVFVKQRNGSSASGVVALLADGKRLRAVSTMEIDSCSGKRRFYNNLKPTTYTSRTKVKMFVNYLCREGVQVQQWLPKASIDGRNFDLRVLVVNGRARQIVVRTSTTPMTNLHLGNRRGDLNQLKSKMSGEQWDAMIEVAESTARAFPASLYLGVDLLLGPGFREPTVIEVNAFGDLLPNVLYQSQTTYETEIQQRLSSG